MSIQIKLAEKYSLYRNSPSLLYNNLSILDDNTFLYASGNTVLRSGPSEKDFSTISSYPEPVIYCFASFLPKYGNVVTVVNQRSVDLFLSNEICVSLVYSKYALTKRIGTSRCVTFCLDKTGMILVFIGTSTGDLICTDFNPSNVGGGPDCLVPKVCINEHKLRSITALDASYEHTLSPVRVVSGDIGGNIVLWNEDRKPHCFIPSCDSESEYATAVKIFGEGRLVAVSFGNGKVVLYETTTGSKSVEICAHAQCINAMAYFHAPDFQDMGDFLATASEDGTVQLFSVAHSDGEVAALVRWLASIELSDVLPTGLCFGKSGKTLALSSYDTSWIFVYKVSEL